MDELGVLEQLDRLVSRARRAVPEPLDGMEDLEPLAPPVLLDVLEAQVQLVSLDLLE